MDLKKALETGFLTVSGSKPFAKNESFGNAALNDRSKFGSSAGLKKQGNTFLLEYTFQTEIKMSGYMIMTANDCPERDPKKWTIENERGEVIHSVENEEKRGRFSNKQYTLENIVSVKKISLRVSDAHDCNECQLARF